MTDKVNDLLAKPIDQIEPDLTKLDDEELQDAISAEKAGQNRATLLRTMEKLAEHRASAADTPAVNDDDPAALKAENDALHAENEKLRDELAAAKASPASAKGKARPAKPQVMKLDGKADESAPRSVVFTNENDEVVTQLPQLDFTKGQFQTTADGWQLRPKIDLPASGPRVSVRKAWLLDDKGKAIACARIGHVPLDVGGGMAGEIAGGMLFRKPEAVAA